MSAKKNETKPEKSAKAAKPAKADKAAKTAGGKKSPAQRGPVLLETAVLLSQLGLIVAGGSIFGVSLQAGADLTMSALRSGAAMLVLGLVLWLMNWYLARGSMEALAQQMQEAAAAQAATHGKLDVNA